MKARSFWVAAPGRGEVREEELRPPREGELLVRAVASGVSRGTERLVFEGRVPASERSSMRCPFQVGDFGEAVKYGYAMVGEVLEGPPELVGRHVFCLHPHQDHFVVPREAVLPLPAALPPRRAVLAANVETAVNALWDAAVRIGDRVTIIGAGVVGAACATLARAIPGVDLEVVDVDATKVGPLGVLGLPLVAPGAARRDRDVVLHASGTPAGLALALEIAGFEALVVELSWYGDAEVPVPLGQGFHSRRLTLQSSQVGHVATARRARRERRDRLALALDLLAAEPTYDALLTGSCALDALPSVMLELARGRPGLFCHVVTYFPEKDEPCTA